jgi:hypothetical protein
MARGQSAEVFMSFLSGNWLAERSRPHYGQLMLAVILANAFCLAGYFLTHRDDTRFCYERTGPASVLSLVPEPWLLDERVSLGCGLVFFVSGALWLGRLLLPWSSILAALSFTGVIALYLENAHQETHVAHATNMLLILYALWYWVDAQEIRSACKAGQFWAMPLYPRWVYSLSVFYLGMFYGLSGTMKLLESGLDWPNGVSMQLWVSLWGNPESWLTSLILAKREIARGLQVATLVIETSGFLAIVLPPLRPVIGLALIGLHVGIVAVFGWAFHFNAVLVALVFLPVNGWIGARPSSCPEIRETVR